MNSITRYFLVLLIFSSISANAQQATNVMSGLYKLPEAKSRSISPENLTGGKGSGGAALAGTGGSPARELGQGWKVSPSRVIQSKETLTLAEIDSSGIINHMWMTATGNWRFEILRIYWDDEKTPSVEVPLGDFFCQGWGTYAPVISLPVCVNPGSAFNCYWQMPFRKKCRITLENIADQPMLIYYQVDYSLTSVSSDAAYFHAQFRRVNPVPFKQDYVLVDSIKGKGQYVGTYMAWAPHDNGWWGEGEIKFFIDGDKDFPTICGTGTEDYFCGSYDFDTNVKNAAGIEERQFTTYSTPYAGLNQVIKGDGHYAGQERFGMYRWHLTDAIRFDKGLKITMQDLGWHKDGRYMPLQDDIASTVFWYQVGPHNPFPPLPDRDHLEVSNR
jgi:hypothetical protein